MNVLLGENVPIARDYMKHYRSSIPNVLDCRYESMETYSAKSWPTYVLIDAEGQIALGKIGLRDNLVDIRAALERVATDEGGEVQPAGVQCKDGVCTFVGEGPIETLEFAPEMAADPEGGAWMVFERRRGSSGDIFLRHSDSEQEHRVTRSMADDYAPDLAVADDGTVWVAWCSRRGEHFDIYARSFREGKWTKEERLTQSADDAMNPAVAVDGSGRPWVTYYEWNEDFGTSRDRDVFARYREEGAWSRVLRVSPLEPKVEDHADPDIVAVPGSKTDVWVAWSYDYHPQLFDKPEDADQPTVFAQRMNEEGPVGEMTLVGTPGHDHHAIDLWPSLATDPDGTVWCAYDARFWIGQRGVLLSSLQGESFAMPEWVHETSHGFQSPRLIIDDAGNKIVVWSERVDGSWRVRGCHDSGDGWSSPMDLVEAEGDHREPVAVVDPEGDVWIAWEEQVGARIRVRMDKVDL